MITDEGKNVLLMRRTDGQEVKIVIDGKTVRLSMTEWSRLISTPEPYRGPPVLK